MLLVLCVRMRPLIVRVRLFLLIRWYYGLLRMLLWLLSVSRLVLDVRRALLILVPVRCLGFRLMVFLRSGFPLLVPILLLLICRHRGRRMRLIFGVLLLVRMRVFRVMLLVMLIVLMFRLSVV